MADSKYTLNSVQIKILKEVHKKIIESGLVRIGIPFKDHKGFIESSEETFGLIIKETQNKLVEAEKKKEFMNDFKK